MEMTKSISLNAFIMFNCVSSCNLNEPMKQVTSYEYKNMLVFTLQLFCYFKNIMLKAAMNLCQRNFGER